MANSQIFDDKLKNEVKATLLQSIIKGLQDKTLTLAGMKTSANYILDNIDKIKNYSQFVVFMDNLKNKWSVFNDPYRIYANKFYKEKEAEVISKLQGYLKNQI